MRTRHTTPLARLTSLAMLSAVAAPTFGQSTITRAVFGTGGGRTTSASLTINCTIGEPVIGPATGPTTSILAGFWVNASAPVCYANCDRSTVAPILNVLDFTCFLNQFAAGDAGANCDSSTSPPILNVLDFTCFLNSFAAGCT